MKRFVLLLLVMLAIPAAASAAISGIGGGTTISNGQATLVANTTSPFSFISFNDLQGRPVGDLTSLSADVVQADFGLGSPRFSVELSNGTQRRLDAEPGRLRQLVRRQVGVRGHDVRGGRAAGRPPRRS
jgi:hypothetical protein